MPDPSFVTCRPLASRTHRPEASNHPPLACSHLARPFRSSGASVAHRFATRSVHRSVRHTSSSPRDSSTSSVQQHQQPRSLAQIINIVPLATSSRRSPSSSAPSIRPSQQAPAIRRLYPPLARPTWSIALTPITTLVRPLRSAQICISTSSHRRNLLVGRPALIR
ncbi:hypothetical protein ACLOJK_038388 [Asimina triloba]